MTDTSAGDGPYQRSETTDWSPIQGIDEQLTDGGPAPVEARLDHHNHRGPAAARSRPPGSATTCEVAYDDTEMVDYYEEFVLGSVDV